MNSFTVTAAFTLTIILLKIQSTVSGTFKVLSPDTPIIVSFGETAILPCYLSPYTNAEDMMERWFRSKFSFTVHLYQNRKNNDLQIPKYQNRTYFNTSLIAVGKVSLSIHSITPSDEGSYTCLFQSLSFYDAADLELKVSALGSEPTIYIEDHQDGHLRAVCTSYGWSVIYWKDDNEHIIHPLSKENSQNALGLYDVEMILPLDSKSNSRLSCIIKHGFLEQEVETSIRVAGKHVNENHCFLQEIESLTANLGDVSQEKGKPAFILLLNQI
ncbi:butyrophilin subfamily 2 member A1-like [Mantella aurantiaca]